MRAAPRSIEDTGEIRLEDLVAVEDVAITVTRGGYRSAPAWIRTGARTRGGKGRNRHGHARRGFRGAPHRGVTHSYLLIFTTRGRVYWLKRMRSPTLPRSARASTITNLINLQNNETAKAFLSVKDFVADQFIVMVTKHGVIKKSELTEFDNPMARGIIAVSLDDGDELIGARITHGNNYIFPGVARRPGDPLQ